MGEVEAVSPEFKALLDQNQRLYRAYIEAKKELERLKRPPLMVGRVLEVLGDRAIVRNFNGMVFLVNISKGLEVKVGDTVGLAQGSLAVVEVIPGLWDVRARAKMLVERPSVSYEDIGGLDDVIEEIKEVVELQLKHPERLRELGVDPPKGILLHGPPGTGKTLLAKAVAHETDATFIHVVGSELVKKYIGEGAELVREIFELARENRPSIIFIDEIDAVAGVRTGDTSGEREVNRTLLQILAEMDGFRGNEGVVVMAATNRVDLLDPAILRPGRFDRIIHVPLPDEKRRLDILRVITRKMKLGDVDLEEIARKTEGFSGAMLKHLCTEAGLRAARKGKKTVDMEEFLEVLGEMRGKKPEDRMFG